MNQSIAEVVKAAGIRPPPDCGEHDVGGAVSLYVDVRLFTKAGLVSVKSDEEGKVAFCALILKQGNATPSIRAKIKATLIAEAADQGLDLSVSVMENTFVVSCPWASRNRFYDYLLLYVKSQVFSEAIWPMEKVDYENDNGKLKEMYAQSRSKTWSSFLSVFSKREEQWKLAHFSVRQVRRDSRGFKWRVEFGANIHLMESMEDMWAKSTFSKARRKIQMNCSSIDHSVELAPTWVAQSLDFRTSDESIETIREFIGFLRQFVGSIYMKPMEEFPVSGGLVDTVVSAMAV